MYYTEEELCKELLAQALGYHLLKNVPELCALDYEKIIKEKALSLLYSIRTILADETISDFDKIDAIVVLLNHNNIDTGSCHDF